MAEHWTESENWSKCVLLDVYFWFVVYKQQTFGCGDNNANWNASVLFYLKWEKKRWLYIIFNRPNFKNFISGLRPRLRPPLIMSPMRSAVVDLSSRNCWSPNTSSGYQSARPAGSCQQHVEQAEPAMTLVQSLRRSALLSPMSGRVTGCDSGWIALVLSSDCRLTLSAVIRLMCVW